MKYIFIITMLFVSFKVCCSQAANWTTNKENGVISYAIQQSKDNIKWDSIATVLPAKKVSNSYSYPLPIGITNYYRIKANVMGSAYYTASILYTAATPPKNSVTILNPTFKNSWFMDNLTWSTIAEVNVDYYQIDKTTDNKKYSLVSKVLDKGNSSYSYGVFRLFGKKPFYRLTVFFKDGASQYVYFK
jgi:hypothetical protein